MLAVRQKKALFGGALRCAGIAAAAVISSSALADVSPVFPLGVNYTSGYVANASGDTVFDDYHFNYAPAFALTTSYTGSGGSLNAYAGPTGLVASVSVLNPLIWGGYAAAVVHQYFTIDSSRNMVFTWDFTHAYDNAYGFVYELGVGIIANDDGVGTAGSLALVMNAGSTYFIRAHATVDSSITDGSASVSLTNVPGPGALALLSLGILGTKRRRRQVRAA